MMASVGLAELHAKKSLLGLSCCKHVEHKIAELAAVQRYQKHLMGGKEFAYNAQGESVYNEAWVEANCLQEASSFE